MSLCEYDSVCVCVRTCVYMWVSMSERRGNVCHDDDISYRRSKSLHGINENGVLETRVIKKTDPEKGEMDSELAKNM